VAIANPKLWTQASRMPGEKQLVTGGGPFFIKNRFTRPAYPLVSLDKAGGKSTVAHGAKAGRACVFWKVSPTCFFRANVGGGGGGRKGGDAVDRRTPHQWPSVRLKRSLSPRKQKNLTICTAGERRDRGVREVRLPSVLGNKSG